MKSSSEIRSVHDMNHAEVEYVLAKIRSKYWIPGSAGFTIVLKPQGPVGQREPSSCPK
jgi:hypothetical protein